MQKVNHCDDFVYTGASVTHKRGNTISTLVEFPAVNPTF